MRMHVQPVVDTPCRRDFGMCHDDWHDSQLYADLDYICDDVTFDGDWVVFTLNDDEGFIGRYQVAKVLFDRFEVLHSGNWQKDGF